MSKSNTLTARHRSYLEAQGIAPAIFDAVCTSITTRDQLPPELHWAYEKAGGGIAFTHTRPDRSTAIQYRPDRPQDDRKYVWPEGVGAVLSVHPSMAQRVDTAARVVIVEGTKQGLVAAGCAGPDDLIVSIQGCWSWSSEGLPVAGWHDVIREGSPVTVSLDADWTTKRTVWDAAERLSGVLKSLGAADVRFVRLPAGGTTGLDDYLGHMPPEKRSAVFGRLLDSATTKLGRRPAASKKDRTDQTTARVVGLTAIVDTERGVIREQDAVKFDEFGQERKVPGDVLLDAAIVVERTIVIRDDRRHTQQPEIQHDLTVYLGDDESGQDIVQLAGIPDVMLSDVPSILRRDPSGRCSHVVRRPGRGVIEAIGEAIRSTASSDNIVTAYRRTGWVNLPGGERGYLHAGGCLTAEGNLDWPRAETSFGRFNLADAATGLTRQDGDGATLFTLSALTAAAESLRAARMMPDATGYYAGLGGLAYAATGNAPRGGVYLLGGHGTGKTTIARVVASALSPDYAPESAHAMVSMQATSTTISEAGAGLEHALCLVDDVRTGASRREQDRMMTGIDSVMRRAYEGGAVGRARQVWDGKTGTLRNVESDPCSPFMLMVGEILPSAERYGSSVERVLTVEMTARVPGSEDRMDLAGLHRVSQDGTMQRAFAAYLIWLNTAGGTTAADIESNRKTTVDRLTKQHPGLSPRAVAVAAGPLVGWRLWCDFVTDVHWQRYSSDADVDVSTTAGLAAHLATGKELLTAEQRATLDELDGYEQAGEDAIVAAMLRHSRVEMSAAQAPHERVLGVLSQMVSSGGRYRIIGVDDEGRDTTITGPGEEAIGKRTTVKNAAGETVHVLALLPTVVARAIGMRSGEDITRALRAVAVVAPDGQSSRPVRIGGTSTRAVCIPISLWDGCEDPESVLSEVVKEAVPADF